MSTGVAQSTVEEVIDQFVSEDGVFSAFDVTKKIRESGDARHYNVKKIVHDLYLSGQLGNNTYSRELVQFDLGHDDADVWVYFPHTKSAYDHPLAKKQTVQVGINTDDDSDGVTVSVAAEHRIQIPRKVLKQVTVTSTDEYKISCNGITVFRKAEADGRVRITESDYVLGTRLDVTVNGNTIEISPK